MNVSRHEKRPNGARRLPIMTSPVAWIVALWCALTCLAFWAFTEDQKVSGAWGCEMPRMWVNFQEQAYPGLSHSKYKVYLYRETWPLANKPSGNPVIFVPGNAGFFGQVRSIASSAERQFDGDDAADRSAWPKPLDFFSIDFNEDFSAFHAPTLRDQADYIAAVVPHVLASYDYLPANARPTRVILLGHSMGGIASRLAASQLPSTVIDSIVTMSTPHQFPPVAIDYEMEKIYSTINNPKPDSLQPLLLSICGGDSDTQIVSDSCALSQHMIGASGGFATFSSGMPGAWTGVDHQAMVWCVQVRWRVARALLDMAATDSRAAKLDAAKRWLLEPEVPADLDASPSSGWPAKESWIHDKIPVASPKTSILLRLHHTTPRTIAYPPVQVSFCEVDDQCRALNLSIRAIPWVRNEEFPFPLKGEGVYPDESALVIVIHESLPVSGYIDIATPSGTEFAVAGPRVETHPGRSRWDFQEGASIPVHAALHFDKPVVSSLLAWRLETKTGICKSHRPVVQHLSKPPSWEYEASHESRYFPVGNTSVVIHSHISGAPFIGQSQSSDGIDVHIYQNPECPIRQVTLKLDLVASLAKAVLRFRIAVLGWCLGWVGLLVFQQLREAQSTGQWAPLTAIIGRRWRQHAAVGAVTLVAASLAQSLAAVTGLPSHGILLGFTHLYLLPFSVATAAWSYGAVVGAECLLEQLVKVGAKLSSTPPSKQTPSPNVQWSVVPRIVAGLILSLLVKFIIPYRMATVMLFTVQLALALPHGREQSPRSYLQASALLVSFFNLPFNAPAIAVWGRDFWVKNKHQFSEDHALLPFLPLLLLVGLSTISRPLSSDKRVLQAASLAALALAAVGFVCAPRRPWLLQPVVNLLYITMCGLVSGYGS